MEKKGNQKGGGEGLLWDECAENVLVLDRAGVPKQNNLIS